jgi:hypothetical protein
VTGRCLCGAVVFDVSEPFETGSFCHCASCKKLSGGVGTANGRARTSAIEIVAGEEHLRTYQPDEGSAKTFCSACGSNLFGAGWPRSEWSSVRLSALDDPGDFRPDKHIFVRSVAAWETIPADGLPQHEATAQA